MRKVKIPEATIRRLPVYLRELDDLASNRVVVTSSADLALRTGFSSEQIRKDLTYFGAFGTRGVGYDTALLANQIRRILRLNHGLKVAIIGAGNLGTALARFSYEAHKDVSIGALFDADPAKVGEHIAGLTVQSMSDLAAVIHKEEIRVAVIAVPAMAAPEVLRRLAEAKVDAVLNFAPVKLSAPGVFVQNLDLTLELQSLAYYACGFSEDCADRSAEED